MPEAKQGEEESEDSDSEMESEEEDESEEESDEEDDEERIAVKGKHRRGLDFKKQFEKKVHASMQTSNGITKKHKVGKGDRSWILKKKERQRRQGKQVRSDSKYTGRKRPGKFF